MDDGAAGAGVNGMAQVWSEIACVERGRSPVMHSHPEEEEAIDVRQGVASMSMVVWNGLA